MKINAVISPQGLKKKNFDLSERTTPIITVLVSAISVICGVLFYIAFKDELYEKINGIFIEFTNEFIIKSKPEIFTGLLLSTLVFFIILFLFSTSIIGEPLIYSAVFVKIMSLAVLVSYIYVEFGLKGIEYCILILFPGKFLLIFATLIMTDSCIYMSKSIRQKDKDIKTDIKKQTVRILIILGVVLLSTTVDFITCTVFSGLFDF